MGGCHSKLPLKKEEVPSFYFILSNLYHHYTPSYPANLWLDELAQQILTLD